MVSLASEPQDPEVILTGRLSESDGPRRSAQHVQVGRMGGVAAARRPHPRRWLAPDDAGEDAVKPAAGGSSGGRGRHRAGETRSLKGGTRRARARAGPGDRLPAWFLRVGLAFVFLYAAVSMLVTPEVFAGYMPSFLPAPWVETICLPCFSVYEVLLAAFLLAGRRLFAVSLLSAVTMAGIVVLNPDSFDLLFRNVAIACAALSLAAQTRVTSAPVLVPAPPPTA